MTPRPVICVLAPSKIPGAGVGVFAARTILANTDLRLFADEDWRPVDWKELDMDVLKRFAATSASEDDDDATYYVPLDPHRMSIGWYLNHSDQPNVDTATWRALRKIPRGEELLIDYRTVGGTGSHPLPSFARSCGDLPE
jgi:hypothetical protein